VFRSVQAMRGVAALMIVLLHILIITGLTPPAIEENFLSAGIDIFFVISGFVMVVATRGKTIGFAGFMCARLERIVPLYWLAMLACLLLIAASGRGVIPPWREIALAYAFIPYTDSNGEMTPFLSLGWTLSYELYFYLAFGATLWLAWRRQLLGLAAIFAVAILLRNVIGHTSAAAFRFTSPLPFEFLAGALLAHLTLGRRLHAATGLALASAGAVLAVILSDRDLPRTICFGIPALFFVAGAVALEQKLASATLTPILLLGDASYSLYLSHPLTLGLLNRLPFPFFQDLSLAAVPIAMAICALAAIGCYRFVERPMLDRMRSMRKGLATSHYPSLKDGGKTPSPTS